MIHTVYETEFFLTYSTYLDWALDSKAQILFPYTVGSIFDGRKYQSEMVGRIFMVGSIQNFELCWFLWSAESSAASAKKNNKHGSPDEIASSLSDDIVSTKQKLTVNKHSTMAWFLLK